MPITIKELLPSDSMSGVVEKINFNFDQLLLAGGGPPGPQGPIGPAGTPGPIGPRGDHWFVGPSAFGQTADHDGISPLKIEDHFLDPSGDVWYYFDLGSSGGTGWTFSGINLMGPAGPQGSTGSSNEWQIHLGASGSAVSNPVWLPEIPVTPAGSTFPDFVAVKDGEKNLIWLGDIDWGWNKLYGFGRGQTGAFDGYEAPKLTIIQNQLSYNKYGINGLAFGAYGSTGGTPTTGGGTSSTIYSDKTSNTNANAFAYLGLYQDQLTWLTSSSLYYTKFGIRTLNNGIKLEAGRAGDALFSPQPIEILANTINLTAYDAGSQVSRQVILQREASINLNNSALRGTSIAVDLHSAPIYQANMNDLGNRWGYINLQGRPVSGFPPSGRDHAYGTVIIGPTSDGNPLTNTTTKAIGIDGQQALAIVRKITAQGATNSSGVLRTPSGAEFRDTSIAFAYPSYKNAADTQFRSSWIGHILAFRNPSDAGASNAIIDNIVIQAGDRPAGNGGLWTNATQTGGRIGIQNDFNTTRKPQMPFHVQMQFLGDISTNRSNAYDGGYNWQSGQLLQGWIAGFDQWSGERRANGIGIGYKGWQNGITGGLSSQFYSNPIINSYYRTDNDQQLPWDQFGVANGYGQGILNPHMYMQTNTQAQGGNIGIGFVPNPNFTVGATESQMVAAYAKLSMEGTLVIGPTTGGYHNYRTLRPANGILVGGPIYQGATTIGSLLRTSVFSGTAINASFGGDVSIASDDLIMGRSFLSKGYMQLTSSPDYALPDTKTGMMMIPGEPNVGYLVGNKDLYNPGTTASPSTTGPNTSTAPERIARFSSRGEYGFATGTGTNQYPGLTVEGILAKRPLSLNTSNLIQKITKYSADGGATYRTFTFWSIPTTSSFTLLDLSTTRGQMVYYPTSGALLAVGIPSGTNYYLDGGNVTNTSPITALNTSWSFNFQGFTLEPGHFDGQVFTLQILGCLPRNQGVLVPSIPVITGSAAQSIATGALQINDNICMQAERRDMTVPNGASLSGTSWPLAQGQDMQTTAGGTAFPYPIPYGSASSITGTFPSNTTTVAALNTWLRDLLGGNGWTNTSASATVPSGTGFGAFRISGYKTISFIWRFDGTGQEGCWYEISRANLVQRRNRSWGGNIDAGSGVVPAPVSPTVSPIPVSIGPRETVSIVGISVSISPEIGSFTPAE